jgi:hypothetical protein
VRRSESRMRSGAGPTAPAPLLASQATAVEPLTSEEPPGDGVSCRREFRRRPVRKAAVIWVAVLVLGVPGGS